MPPARGPGGSHRVPLARVQRARRDVEDEVGAIGADGEAKRR